MGTAQLQGAGVNSLFTPKDKYPKYEEESGNHNFSDKFTPENVTEGPAPTVAVVLSNASAPVSGRNKMRRAQKQSSKE